jgi:hypothetical protein
MIDALMYGMIPRAIIDTLVKPPPENIDKMDSRVLSEPALFALEITASAFTPGSMMKEPMR